MRQDERASNKISDEWRASQESLPSAVPLLELSLQNKEELCHAVERHEEISIDDAGHVKPAKYNVKANDTDTVVHENH